MRREDLLLRTKLSPPRLRRQVLPRPALLQKLRMALDYRLTLVQAGTGYGKTTALAALDHDGPPLFWYSAEEADADPQRFLSYLIAAFQIRLPQMSDLPRAVLEDRGSAGTFDIWTQTLDSLINALADAIRSPALLIIDDYHFIANSADIAALTERFIAFLPDDLHVVLATRHRLTSTAFVRLRMQGELFEIDDAALAFRPSEIAELFGTIYGMQLTPHEIASLAEKTDGWPIALQMVWQDLRSDAKQSAAELLTRGPASLTALFDYLAREVLARQPPDLATFLSDTAVLRKLTPAACDAVRDCRLEDDRPHLQSSAELLDRLHRLDLFVIALGEGHYRYHHLFHDFLRQHAAADPAGTHERHRRAAQFFEARQEDEEAIYHWLAAQAFASAASAIERAGETALLAGRLDTVAAWVDAIPPEVLATRPLLHVYRGDVFRLRSAFDRALAWYDQAERTWRARDDKAGLGRALRSRASIYLDTVQPAAAERVLEEALLLIDDSTDRASHARLLELVAENKLNLGDPAGAEALRVQARMLREEGPSEDVVGVRVKFRTGRLAEARQILEDWVAAERSTAELAPARAPQAHRENLLLLSITYAFLGQAEQAVLTAREGIALGERLQSPFITAVAHTRLGHALQLRRSQAWPFDAPGVSDEAINCFQAALAASAQLAVRRARVEALWGLTRAYGFSGDVEAAARAAEEGVAMARLDGDAWLAAMIELMLGASYVLAGRAQESIAILSRVLLILRECGDSFGRAATRLWLSMGYLDLQQREHFATCVEALLEICETHSYDCLFTDPSMLAPPDSRRLVPLLIEARARRRRPLYAARLLAALGLADITIHPGYQLRVQTLGGWRVWRGAIEIEPREWQRDKARQLFQLLVSQRGRWLQRDEIVEHLWPHLAPEAAVRDFKVALTAMNKALEPGRSPDAPFAFVVREGTAYRLRLEADLWVDAVAFERACEAAQQLLEGDARDRGVERLQTALRLYAGDYLPDALYEDWAGAERERLLALYLRAADRLAEASIERGRYDEAIDISQRILARDPCWERAYCWMMLAYARQGNRPQSLRVYQRCKSVLDAELGVPPSPPTAALYQRIVQADERRLPGT